MIPKFTGKIEREVNHVEDKSLMAQLRITDIAEGVKTFKPMHEGKGKEITNWMQ